MKWIIPFDQREDNVELNGALYDGGVCWKQSNKFQVNDIVYIYESYLNQHIKYKCRVTATNKTYTVLSESEYGGAHVGESLYPGFEIQLEYEFVYPVTLKKMIRHGLNTRRIRVLKENAHPELFEYLEEYEVADKEYVHLDADIEDDLDNLPGAEREALIKIRINQGDYRQKLLKKYSHCCLCGVSNPGLLVASHIKPWSKCNKTEKTDQSNGLLLCPNHDRLFDKGYISFDNKGHIIISDQLSESDRKDMNISDNISIKMSARTKNYMRYHRRNIFKDK